MPRRRRYSGSDDSFRRHIRSNRGDGWRDESAPHSTDDVGVDRIGVDQRDQHFILDVWGMELARPHARAHAGHPRPDLLVKRGNAHQHFTLYNLVAIVLHNAGHDTCLWQPLVAFLFLSATVIKRRRHRVSPYEIRSPDCLSLGADRCNRAFRSLFNAIYNTKPDLFPRVELCSVTTAVNRVCGRSHAVKPAKLLADTVNIDHFACLDPRIANRAPAGGLAIVKSRQQFTQNLLGRGRRADCRDFDYATPLALAWLIFKTRQIGKDL